MRHLQLIAISGSIGSAVFVSIGNPLTNGGPMPLIMGILFWSSVVYVSGRVFKHPFPLMKLTDITQYSGNLQLHGGDDHFATC